MFFILGMTPWNTCTPPSRPVPRMDIASLQAFVAVADSGSFSVAAERLFLTQPAVSKRISALEAELGVRLFDRLGRRVLVTEAGGTLLPRARHILAELDDSRRALSDLSGQVAGRLSVATSHHVGLHRLPPVLRAYTASYPQVQLDLRFMASEAACLAVAGGDVELAIVTLPLAAEAPLALQTIWTDRLVLVAHPGHPLARLKRVSPFRLVEHAAILPEHGTFTRELIERCFEPLGIRLRVAFTTNFLETIKMMVSIGLGWSLLPRTMLDAQLAVLELEGIAPTRALGLVAHAGHTPSNAARALLGLLAPGEGGGPAEPEPWRGY